MTLWPCYRGWGLFLSITWLKDPTSTNKRGRKARTWNGAMAERAARSVACLHPAFPDCPGHEFWKRDFTGSSGLFSIVLKPEFTQKGWRRCWTICLSLLWVSLGDMRAWWSLWLLGIPHGDEMEPRWINHPLTNRSWGYGGSQGGLGARFYSVSIK